MNTDRPFDLAKIDTEATRKNKRKKLLLVSLPLIAIVFLLGLWFMAPRLATKLAINNYERGSYGSSQAYLRPLSFANMFERYKLYFNRGTAAAMNKQYEYAADQFVIALAYVNDEAVECRIRYNLVLTYVKQAESFVATKKLAEAVVAYTKALVQIDAKASCFDTKLRQDIAASRDDIRKLMEAEGEDENDESSDEGNNGNEPSDSQQQKLEEIERGAAIRRQEDKEFAKPIEPLRDIDDYVDKPW
ncbi:MAG: hypothetical protein WBP26_00800 [Candidatus Saccharimonadales bacterium]